jgi:hypothetical protein
LIATLRLCLSVRVMCIHTIGRLVANAKRELVIDRRSHGYVALYRYVPEIDTVFVLAIRSQREAGDSERGSAG